MLVIYSKTTGEILGVASRAIENGRPRELKREEVFPDASLEVLGVDPADVGEMIVDDDHEVLGDHADFKVDLKSHAITRKEAKANRASYMRILRSETPPNAKDDLWYDTKSNKVKYWNGTGWVSM